MEQPDRLTIRWQRIPLAFIGLLSVLAWPFSLLLALTQVIGFAWVGLFTVLALGSIIGLRWMAVRSRHKPFGYHQHTTAAKYRHRAGQTKAQVPGLSPVATGAQPFDAAEPATEDSTAEQAHELSAAAPVITSLDQAVQHPEVQDREAQVLEAPETASTNGDDIAAEAAAAQEGAAVTATATEWEPTQVPAPRYTQAAVVPRAEPQPLELPAEPIARSHRLKDAAGPLAPTAAGEDRAEQQRQVRTTVRAHQAKAGALNLDDVLARRRA